MDTQPARDVQLVLTLLLDQDETADIDEQEVIDAIGRLADESHRVLCSDPVDGCSLWTSDATYVALHGDGLFRPVITVGVAGERL